MFVFDGMCWSVCIGCVVVGWVGGVFDDFGGGCLVKNLRWREF